LVSFAFFLADFCLAPSTADWPQRKSCTETSPRHTVTSRASWTLPSGVSQVMCQASVLPLIVIVSGPDVWRLMVSVYGVPGAARKLTTRTK
jgi:hypothetical protein